MTAWTAFSSPRILFFYILVIDQTGDEISDEEAAVFLDNDPEAEEEAEEEPLFFPASVTINQAFYLTPGRAEITFLIFFDDVSCKALSRG